MKLYKIALLKGDGIGPEIIDATQVVLEAVSKKFDFDFEYQEAVIGGIAIDTTGTPLPQETIDVCKQSDAVLLGAVGGVKWETLPGAQRPEAGLLGIRTALNLFANLRPAIVYNALKDASPLKEDVLGDSLDILVVRELTGGIYFGSRGRKKIGNIEAAYDTEEYTVPEIERIAHVAFQAAQKRSKSVCSVDKANVLESSRLWRETVTRIAEQYPEITLSHMYVDNAAMQLVRNPQQFDVILTNNIFGDILSDEASQITGSIGMLPSASLSNSKLGLYEPIHGSAPDIAGKDIANPLATILAAAMMLRYSLDEQEAADAIEAAVDKTLEAGHRTTDIAQKEPVICTTKEMGHLVAQMI